MGKSDRLFRLLHLMRSLRPPVTAARLADELTISERTLYRDIEALRAAGARIEGEAGLGYTMSEDVALPPQTLSRMEIEALIIGLGEAEARGDLALKQAAKDALTKIIASLPDSKQRQAMHAISMVRRYERVEQPEVDMTLLRNASWNERAVDIAYEDREGKLSKRRIYPLSIVYLKDTVMLLAWCCLREDFRQFHIHMISSMAETKESFRPKRVELLRKYIDEMHAKSRAYNQIYEK
jgi:predicted DNA-binding transcriptional regulator YafY